MATVTSEPASNVSPRGSARWWKIVGLVVLIVAGLVAAGSIGYAIGDSGSKSSPKSSSESGTFALTDAQSRYFALAQFADRLCGGAGGNPVAAPGSLDCKTALAATAEVLRQTTWPDEAKAAAATLAAAIDTHVAFLQRLDRASPAEQQQLLAGIYKDPSNSPYAGTARAAGVMREAMGLHGSANPL